MRKILFLLFSLCATALTAGEVFKHTLPEGKKPWTHENFLNGEERFSFAIVPDRTGSERPGIFGEAVRKANLLQPEFIMSVGDLIQGPTDINKQSPDDLRAQWKELLAITEKSEAPFFYLVGNHDISYTRKGFPRGNEDSAMVWKEFAGPNTYYYFVYKNVLFLCLNVMEGRDSRKPQVGITDEQVKWAIDVLNKHQNVRWTLVFLHQPSALNNGRYPAIENVLRRRNYTCFAGDWHHYIKFRRHGRNHYVLATAGGTSAMRGVEYGEFDHITYVTMTKNGPVVANILLDGILDDDVVTAENIKRHYTEILDTEPFKYNKKYPWRAVVGTEKLKTGTGNEYFSVNTNQITLRGKNIKGQKRVEKVIDLDHPNVGGKTLRVVCSIRAELPTGKQSSFNVHARILDANNKVIACGGLTLKDTRFWKYRRGYVKVPPEGKRVQLVISGVNFDEKSIGEARNVFVFEDTK